MCIRRRSGSGAGRRIPAILLTALCLCLLGGAGTVRAAGEHLRLEVELVEEGARNETRVVDLDLRGTGKAENDDWMGLLLALGLVAGTMPVWMWLGRPKAASASKGY